MASYFGTHAGSLVQYFDSSSGGFDGSGRLVKRKRDGGDFGPPTTPNPIIERSKRPKHSKFPYFLSTQSSKSDKALEIRVPDAPSRSATTAVYTPCHVPHAVSSSASFDVLSFNRGCNGHCKTYQLDLRHMWHGSLVHDSSDEGSDNTKQKTKPNFTTDTMTIVERKFFFIHTPTEGMKAATKRYFSEVYQLLDMSGSNDDCRLHPTPPQFNGKAAGLISFGFAWRDEYGPHKLSVNWGIVALVVRQQLTDAQIDGSINNAWQLSHLCGNWTCCNWRHFTVESGFVNRNRNACFNSPARCAHTPPCMKEKKRKLLVTNHIRNEISKAITSLGGTLSYEEFHALEEYEVHLMEWFWENSRRGSCAFCGRSDDRAHICSYLSSLADCKVMLRALKQCIKPTSEVKEAIGYLVNIKDDLERGSAVKNGALTEWLICRGRSGASYSAGYAPIKPASTQMHGAGARIRATKGF